MLHLSGFSPSSEERTRSQCSGTLWTALRREPVVAPPSFGLAGPRRRRCGWQFNKTFKCPLLFCSLTIFYHYVMWFCGLFAEKFNILYLLLPFQSRSAIWFREWVNGNITQHWWLVRIQPRAYPMHGWKKSMTICCRIDGVQTYNDMSSLSRDLLKMSASSRISVLNFGYPATRTTFNSYLLRDNSGDYEVFRPFVWNHICFTFKKGSYSRIVLVGKSY